MVKNPPANAGDMGSIPGLGRSQMLQGNEHGLPQPRSLHAASTETHAPRAWAPPQEKLPQWEAHAPHLESTPPAATRNSLLSAKNKSTNLF